MKVKKYPLHIQNAIGFCKNCFRNRRHGSAYCGECQNEGGRMPVFHDFERKHFPLYDKVKKKFKLEEKDLEHVIFTYGDTIYCDDHLSYGLVAHELTHVFQQVEMNQEIWWEKYLKSSKFRLEQEAEAYKRQYQVMKSNDPMAAEFALTSMARNLSGKLYGNMVTMDEALEIITK